jgi:hypothetical protein
MCLYARAGLRMNTLDIRAAALALLLPLLGCARQDPGRAAQQYTGCLLSTAQTCVEMLRALHSPRESDFVVGFAPRVVPILETPDATSARRMVIHLAEPRDEPKVWQSFSEGNWIDRRRVTLDFAAGQDTISSIELYFPHFAPEGLSDTAAEYDRVHLWPLLNDVLPVACRFSSRTDGYRVVANLALWAAAGGSGNPPTYKSAEPSRVEAETDHCGLTVHLVRWDVRGHAINGMISARWTTIRFSAQPDVPEQRRPEDGQAGAATDTRRTMD